MKIKILSETSYQLYPVVSDMVEVSEEDLELIGKGKKFDLQKKAIVNDSNYKDESIYITIEQLKSKLRETDYQAIKFAEGEMSEEEFAPIKEQRKNWRAKINKLEEDYEL